MLEGSNHKLVFGVLERPQNAMIAPNITPKLRNPTKFHFADWLDLDLHNVVFNLRISSFGTLQSTSLEPCMEAKTLLKAFDCLQDRGLRSCVVVTMCFVGLMAATINAKNQ